MPIPDFQTLMLPVLRSLADGKPRSLTEIVETLAVEYKLSEAERSELMPNGASPRFNYIVRWSMTYLFKAMLASRKSRGVYSISERGTATLKENPARIDMRFLTRFPEYVEWRESSTRGDDERTAHPAHDGPAPRTPEEQIGGAYQEIRAALADDILDKVKSCSPRFFERLVVDLLVRMGYGGTLPEAGQVIGKSGDGGIDGLIKEDKLGLGAIYLQAKRWEGLVPVGAVRDFSGSLDAHGAKKGVMISTSSFTSDAKTYVTKTGEKKIVLIDGYELAQLMIDHDVGVTPVTSYTIKRIDSDYFEEE
ncbi:restriction endonuclease [candidate division KSB1 bacterium]|nr:restriction endonuclease [candidate division KSB1 bacterium]